MMSKPQVADVAMLAAIRQLADAWKRELQKPNDDAEQIAALRRVAGVVSAWAPSEAARLLKQANGLFMPERDPFTSRRNVFGMFNLEYVEPRWTQWLRGLLDPAMGGETSRIAWKALCRAIEASESQAAQDCGGDVSAAEKEIHLAGRQDWQEAASDEPKVQAEVSGGPLGRIDLLAFTPKLVVGIEMKLWEGWHDGEGEKQADRYRKLVKRAAARKSKPGFGLVVLACWDESQREKHGVPDDYVFVHWRSFAQALRRGLQAAPTTTEDMWPVMATLVSIEQDLLELVPPPPRNELDADIRGVARLERVVRYLEEVQDEQSK